MGKCFTGRPKKLQIRGGIALVCGIILAVGLFIIGRGLPKMITSKLMEHICIDSADHSGYVDWLGNEANRPSYQQFRVFYWNITNKNRVLYHGEKPKVKEIGPYIYRFASSKHDVHFNSTMQTYKYKSVTQSGYDKTATAKLCPTCNENDKITVANLAYIGLMLKTGGDTNFAMTLIPTAASTLLTIADGITGGRSNTLKAFGGNGSVVPSNLPVFPPGWGPAEFGKWIWTENGKTGSVLKGVLTKLSRTSFTEKEMKAVYDMITNPVALGTAVAPSTLALCQTTPTRSGCGYLLYARVSAIRTASLVSSGLIANISTDPLLLALMSNMQTLLCTNSTLSCLTLNPDLITAITLYTTQHLIKFAIYLGIDSHDYGVIITRTQRELSSGFVMDKLKIPSIYPNGVPVKGFVPNDTDKAKAIKDGKFSEFFNCKSDEGAFKWNRYKGETHLNPDHFPGASKDFREVKSNSILVGFAKNLSPCKAGQSPNEKAYMVFQPVFSQKARLVYEKDTSVDGIHVNKFILDHNQLLSQNNVSVFVKGILDLERANSGIPLLFSMPHFYGADKSLSMRFNMKPSTEAHHTFYKYEPITGAPLAARQGFQVNTIIPDMTVSCPRQPSLNISYKESMKSRHYQNVFPIYWIETSVVAPTDKLGTVKQIYGVLQGSCACMVLGPLLGVLLGLLGSFCLIKSCKKGRVVEELSPGQY